MDNQNVNLAKQLSKLEELEKKRLETNVNVVTFISNIVGTIVDGFTTYFLFNWFIAETFDIRKISFVSALGIYTLFNFFNAKVKILDDTLLEDKDKIRLAVGKILLPLFTLLSGYIIHLFM